MEFDANIEHLRLAFWNVVMAAGPILGIALAIGLVVEVVESGNALQHCIDMLQPIEKQSPTAVEYCKELIMAAREQPMSAGYVLERQRFVELWQDDNQFEGVSAFLEKRPAQWRGKTKG